MTTDTKFYILQTEVRSFFRLRILNTGCLIFLFTSCIKEAKEINTQDYCTLEVSQNITMSELIESYKDKTIEINKDLIIEGYVISSDQFGNFFRKIFIQDHPSSPRVGIQIEIDLQDSYLFFPLGSKVLIKLKGLYFGKQKELFKLGGALNSFGNISIGRLPTSILFQHLLLDCNNTEKIIPVKASLSSVNTQMLGTLIKLSELEVIENEKDSTFAISKEETTRTLTNCSANKIELVNSGYSDFYNAGLPKGNGSITGVLTKKGKTFQMIIRDTTDIFMKDESCLKSNMLKSTKKVLISEIADPNNNLAARFIELYNHDSVAINLDGWTLKRYTNANITSSAMVDLSGLVINSDSALVLTANMAEFITVYGFLADLEVRSNGPADSNGDDNFELIDPFGKVIDSFGIIGEDGTQTNHDFENGKASRKSEVVEANPDYTFDEWNIYNDNNVAGTINRALYSPEDYSPGFR